MKPSKMAINIASVDNIFVLQILHQYGTEHWISMDTFKDTIYLEFNIPRIGASSIITNMPVYQSMHNYMHRVGCIYWGESMHK
jgi:hypothetical protein